MSDLFYSLEDLLSQESFSLESEDNLPKGDKKADDDHDESDFYNTAQETVYLCRSIENAMFFLDSRDEYITRYVKGQESFGGTVEKWWGYILTFLLKIIASIETFIKKITNFFRKNGIPEKIGYIKRALTGKDAKVYERIIRYKDNRKLATDMVELSISENIKISDWVSKGNDFIKQIEELINTATSEEKDLSKKEEKKRVKSEKKLEDLIRYLEDVEKDESQGRFLWFSYASFRLAFDKRLEQSREYLGLKKDEILKLCSMETYNLYDTGMKKLLDFGKSEKRRIETSLNNSLLSPEVKKTVSNGLRIFIKAFNVKYDISVHEFSLFITVVNKIYAFLSKPTYQNDPDFKKELEKLNR